MEFLDFSLSFRFVLFKSVLFVTLRNGGFFKSELWEVTTGGSVLKGETPLEGAI